jgi:hypothetical protein
MAKRQENQEQSQTISTACLSDGIHDGIVVPVRNKNICINMLCAS